MLLMNIATMIANYSCRDHSSSAILIGNDSVSLLAHCTEARPGLSHAYNVGLHTCCAVRHIILRSIQHKLTYTFLVEVPPKAPP